MKWTAYLKGINVAAQVNVAASEIQKKNRTMLLKIMSTLRFLACQGLAIRGHTDENSNFHNLLQLRCEDDDNLLVWLQQKTAFCQPRYSE